MKQAATLFVIIAVVAGCVDPVGVTKLDQPEEGRVESSLSRGVNVHPCSPQLADDKKARIRNITFQPDVGQTMSVSIASLEDTDGFHVAYTEPGSKKCGEMFSFKNAAPMNLRSFVDYEATRLFDERVDTCDGAQDIYDMMKTRKGKMPDVFSDSDITLVGITLASLNAACAGVEAPKPGDDSWDEWDDERKKKFLSVVKMTTGALFGDSPPLDIPPKSEMTTYTLGLSGGVVGFDYDWTFSLEIGNQVEKGLRIRQSFNPSPCLAAGYNGGIRWGMNFEFSPLEAGKSLGQKSSAVTFFTEPVDSTKLNGSIVTAWNSPDTSSGKNGECDNVTSTTITKCDRIEVVAQPLYDGLQEQAKAALGQEELPEEVDRILVRYAILIAESNYHMLCTWTDKYQAGGDGNLSAFRPEDITDEQIEAIVYKLKN